LPHWQFKNLGLGLFGVMEKGNDPAIQSIAASDFVGFFAKRNGITIDSTISDIFRLVEELKVDRPRRRASYRG
jgi:hypothetical protein